jgi:glycogen debranching enzyme
VDVSTVIYHSGGKLKLVQIACILFIIFIQIGCREDAEIWIPLIEVFDTENIYTFTNKNSGVYLGQTHSGKLNQHSGWSVNGYHYLNDYQIFCNGQILSRDSVQLVQYYPHQLIRRYNNGVIETFSFIDSLNVIFWQMSSQSPNMEFALKPLFPDSSLNKHILDKNTPTLILSTIKHIPEPINRIPYKMGFQWRQTSANQTEVLCVLGKDEEMIKQNIVALSGSHHQRTLKRQHDILDLLAINDVVTNFPEISEAVQWAQISLDALVCHQPNLNILAGLPNSQMYLGRDTFISLSGAFLVNGKFSQARQILATYAKHQLTNPDDSWFGRIPNRITDHEIIYNTADVTWWFIRAVYEYLLYSGDVEFGREIFPVIKTAIQGALRYRIDEYFFLCHDEDETWMSPPRGNRAVEIQVLWYTALQIASKLAILNSERTLSEHWHVISQTLKQNLTSIFWNDYSFHIYDHILPDGKVSKKIRPNQIFAVTIPDLAGIEPLFELEERAHVTNQVTNKLTFWQGVSTLWQKDPDYSVTIDNNTPIKDNGLICSWLTGPLVTALTNISYNNLAFELFYNESIQILEQDAIGNLAEYTDVPIHSDHPKQNVKGSVSSARSLAEYTRNFYQNIIGFMPNAMVNVAEFNPVLTEELTYVHAKLYFSENMIIYEASKNENMVIFNIQAPNLADTVKIMFNFAGYDISYQELTPDHPKIQMQFELSRRRRYKKYNHLDWYFAQPEEN